MPVTHLPTYGSSSTRENPNKRAVMSILSELHQYQAWLPLVFVAGAFVGNFINTLVYHLPVAQYRKWLLLSVDIIEAVPEYQLHTLGIRNKLTADSADETNLFNLWVIGPGCPDCSGDTKRNHKIPFASYWFNSIKCIQCNSKTSIRYRLIDLVTALLTLLVIGVFGLTWAGLAACVLTWGLVALSLIDIDTLALPDNITLPFLWLGLGINYYAVITPLDSAFLGAVFGYFSLWSVYYILKLITGKEGMGHGDFKMLGLLGAWVGIQAIPLILVLSSFIGIISAGVMVAFGRYKKEQMAFGPFLAVAGFIGLLCGDAIIQVWTRLMW